MIQKTTPQIVLVCQIMSDHGQFDHTQFEKFYKWFCFSHLKNGFMCKICTVFYGDSLVQNILHEEHGLIVFKENPGQNCINIGN